MITRPTGLALRDWSDAVVLDLDRFGAFSKLSNDDWRAWGVQFLNNSIIGRNLPDPNGFSDWRDWAERLCSTTL